MWFDLSEVPPESSVISAELRLFVNLSLTEERHQEEDEEMPIEVFSLSLYRVGKNDDLIYVDQMDIQRHQGWIVFNVTNPLRLWLQQPEENFGLQLVCRLPFTGIVAFHS